MLDKTWNVLRQRTSIFSQKSMVKEGFESVTEYPISYSGKVYFGRAIDEKGTALVFMPSISSKPVYAPISIAQYALGCYSLFLRNKKKKWLEKFLKQAEWLAREFQKSKTCYWVSNYPNTCYGIKESWVSSMVQSQCISVMLRAHKETGEEKYIEIALDGAKAFERPLSEDGLRYSPAKDLEFYEEVVGAKHPLVLNGLIFSLLGLYELGEYTGEKKFGKMFEKGCLSILGILRFYDLGYWSRYDLACRVFGKNKKPYVASPWYHKLHIEELKALHTITGKEEFKKYSEKFKSYINPGDFAKAVKEKAFLAWNAKNMHVYENPINKLMELDS